MYLGSVNPTGVVKAPVLLPLTFNIPGVNAPVIPTRTEFVTLPKPDNLDEVVVNVKRIATPVEEDLPEIAVTGRRIQWWQWLAAGAGAILLVNALRS